MNNLFFYLFLGLYAGIALLNIIAPRRLWRATARLRYKNSEAVEPSDFAFMMQRVVGVILLGFAVFLIVTKMGS